MKDTPGATRDYDWWLIAILLAICTLGVIEIYSATQGSNLAGMHTKQIRWLVVGFILMFVLSRLDYHLILDQAWILYLIGVSPSLQYYWSAIPASEPNVGFPSSARLSRCQNS